MGVSLCRLIVPPLGETGVCLGGGLGHTAWDQAPVTRDVHHPVVVIAILNDVTLDAPLLVDGVWAVGLDYHESPWEIGCDRKVRNVLINV